jgi:chitinase
LPAGLAAPKAAVPRFAWGPYKDASIHLPVDPPRLSMRLEGKTVDVVPSSGGAPGMLPRGSTVTWAFATGECGREQIAGIAGEKFAQANAPAFDSASVDFIVSTGGEAGRFSCATARGMERFLSHYRFRRLAGVDFDIEGTRTAPEVDALTRAIAAAQPRHAGLRWSFTLASFAGSDPARASLNALGEDVIAAARRNGVRDFTVNLMVMDYGTPAPAVCVLRQQSCDMARSAIQAAENLHARFDIPYDHIELTAMIGVNDTVGSVTTLEDIRSMARFVHERRLAGLHYWSLDRDAPCARAVAQSDCSGLKEPALSFARAIAEILR